MPERRRQRLQPLLNPDILSVNVHALPRLVGLHRGVEYLLHFDPHVKTGFRLVIMQDGIDKKPGTDQMFVEYVRNAAWVNAL